tara:strand:- start:177 stop:527 length:351 start_codon:yes stop_codon:yes gene_type:complete
MSDIAENFYNDNKLKWLENHESIESIIMQYNDDFGCNFVNAYFIILNPDSEKYDEQLTRLECDYDVCSILNGETIHAGFIVPNGEVCRVILIPNEMDESELKKILPDIIFDLHKIK